MVAFRQIIVLCLFLALANGSDFKRLRNDLAKVRKFVSGLVHQKLNSRNIQRHLGMYQSTNLDSNDITSQYENYIPTEIFEYDFFEPVNFNEQSFDTEKSELDDNSEDSLKYTDYYNGMKDLRSGGYYVDEEGNVKYDIGHRNPDVSKSYIGLKKDIFKRDNNKENTERDSLLNVDVENKKKPIVTSSHIDYSDSTGFNLNINRNVFQDFKKPEKATEMMSQNSNNMSSLMSDVFGQPLYAPNVTYIPPPSPSLINYPYPYLSNHFVPNNSPVNSFPPTLTGLNNGAQYNNQPFLTPSYGHPPGTVVPNNNMVPIPSLALPNAQNYIANGYTIVATPNNGYPGTNGFGTFNNPIYQNPYLGQQPYYVVQLANGQTVLVPYNYVVMFVNNNSPFQNVGSGIIPNYGPMTSNGRKLPPMQESNKVILPDNRQQTDSNIVDSQNVSIYERFNTGNDQPRSNNNFGNGEIGQGMQDGKYPLYFRNSEDSSPPSTESDSVVLFRDESENPSLDTKTVENNVIFA